MADNQASKPAAPPPKDAPKSKPKASSSKLSDRERESDEVGISRNLNHDEIESLIADDLEPGKVGFIELDESGMPTGTAFTEPPDGDQIVTTVQAVLTIPEDGLLTPAGAPLTTQMNPVPARLMDAAFLERNPPAEVVEPKDVAERKRRIAALASGDTLGIAPVASP